MEHNHQSNSGSIAGIIILGVLIWGGYQLFFKPDKWTGVYELPYTNTIGALSFETKEACAGWLLEQKNNPNGRYGFECGSNCKPPKTEFGLYECEETFD